MLQLSRKILPLSAPLAIVAHQFLFTVNIHLSLSSLSTASLPHLIADPLSTDYISFLMKFLFNFKCGVLKGHLNFPLCSFETASFFLKYLVVQSSFTIMYCQINLHKDYLQLNNLDYRFINYFVPPNTSSQCWQNRYQYRYVRYSWYQYRYVWQCGPAGTSTTSFVTCMYQYFQYVY